MERLTLMSIVEAFNAPINEEHAWSVCYQCANYLRDKWEGSPETCRFNGIEAVELYQDGTVSIIHSSEEPVENEYELLQAVGVAIFQALDYGLSEGEEQQLSPALELLISRMTGSESDDEDDEKHADADEGIGADDDSHNATLTLAGVMQMCSDHLAAPQEAGSHYRAVCRALVSEAIELSSFLEKIDRDKTHLPADHVDGDTGLDELQRADWARLWMQMMRELRRGVKLKKVELSSQRHLQPVEYELTPYEVLISDIRLRRYTLNRVAVNNDIPANTRKDAHDIMLEFIRSRPPLHSVSERKLASPPPRPFNDREKLLEDIRRKHKLNPVLSRFSAERTSTRKVIKPDLSLLKFNNFDDDDDDEDDDEEDDDDKNKVEPLSPLSPLTPLSPTSQSSSPLSCSQIDNNNLDLNCQKQSLPISSSTARPNSSSCLSLTVEEVMHIRRVLTKAELECLLVDPVLHDLLVRGKVCFTCKKTRFSFFQWSSKCKFCSRNVCTKCVTKMRISAEHFERIPVYTLSPGSPPQSTSPTCEMFTSPVADHLHNSSSWRPPMTRSQTVAAPGILPTPRIPAAPPSGPERNVCRDCRAMIANIVRASHWSSAGCHGNSAGDKKTTAIRPTIGGRPSRDLHLDLQPVYLSGFRKIKS